jgi:hypothetical protein
MAAALGLPLLQAISYVTRTIGYAPASVVA